MEPPGPVPNPEVKHFSADGSWAIGPVRVGRRQFICPLQANACSGLFLCRCGVTVPVTQRRGKDKGKSYTGLPSWGSAVPVGGGIWMRAGFFLVEGVSCDLWMR